METLAINCLNQVNQFESMVIHLPSARACHNYQIYDNLRLIVELGEKKNSNVFKIESIIY